MATIDKLVISLLCFVTATYAGEWCSESGWDVQYCSTGCCGPSYDQYCCLDGNTGTIVGIVIGCIAGVGGIITVVVIIFCCCRRGRGAQGQVMTPARTTMTTTTVGQNVYPVTSPAYPGASPYGQPNSGFAQPYQPYPQQPVGGPNMEATKPPPYSSLQ